MVLVSTVCTSNTSEAASNSSSSKSYDAHMYGVGVLAILAIGLLVYFKIRLEVASS